MTEFLDELAETPHRITLSGDGLKRMDVRVFKGMVRNLGRIGIEVEGYEIRPEVKTEPYVIQKVDFMRVARQHDLSKVNAGKTWHALIEPRRKYTRALDKLTNGARMFSWEKDALHIPQWQVALSASEDELLYDNLAEAHEKEILHTVEGMGNAYVGIVSIVLKEMEIAKDTPDS